MFFLGAFFATLLLLTFVAIVGHLVVRLLPGSLQDTARVYLAPLFGLGILVLIATVHGWIAPFTPWSTMSVTVLVILVSLWFERANKLLLPSLATTVVIGACTLVVHVSPLLEFGAYNSFNDAFTYLVQGQWLQQHSFAEKVVTSGNYPAWTQVHVYQLHGSRIAPSFVLAWVQALFGLEWSYYAFPIVVGLALACAALAVGAGVLLSTSETFRYRHPVAVLAAIAVASTPNGFHFGTILGFLPQTFGLAFAAGCVVLFAGILEEAAKRPIEVRRVARNVAPAALLMAALVYCYNDSLGWISISAAVFILMVYVSRLVPGPVLAAVTAVFLVEVVVLIAPEVPRIVRNAWGVLNVVSWTNPSPIGWPIPWAPYEFLAHLFGTKPSAHVHAWIVPGRVAALSLLVVLLLTVLLSLRRAATRVGTLAVGSVLIVSILGFIYFRYAVPAASAGEIGHTFLQFKFVKWASPFAFTLLGIAVLTLANSDRFKGAWLFIAPLVVLVILGGITGYQVVQDDVRRIVAQIGPARDPFSALLALRRQASFIPSGEPIYLDIGKNQEKLRQAIYVLHDRPLMSNWSTDGYLNGLLPEKERVWPVDAAKWVIHRTSAQDAVHGLPTVGQLILRRRTGAVFTFLGSSGGYGLEIDKLGWGEWVRQSATYRFEVLGTAPRIGVVFSFMATTKGLALTVVVRSGNDDKLAEAARFNLETKQGWNEFNVSPVAASGRIIAVELISHSPPVTLAEGDPRISSFHVRNLHLREMGN